MEYMGDSRILTKTKHIGWIDFLKGIAMLGVVTDHSLNLLYTNPTIQKLSFYSVTLFVFLGGITSYLSMQSKNVSTYDRHYLWKRLKSIIIPYAMASGLSLCVVNHYFDVGVYLKTLVGFSAWPPYYFIVFFLQLIIISPVLFIV